jgi:hypothetical protein
MNAKSEDFRRLTEERERLLKQIDDAKSDLKEKDAAVAALTTALDTPEGGSGAFGKAAALVGLGSTSDMSSLAQPIADYKLAKATKDGTEDYAKAVAGTVDCVENRMATISLLEDAAFTEQATIVQELGDQMRAKQQETLAREKAVRDAWAASNDIGGGPEVPRLIEEYLRGIDQYLELGTQFEAALKSFQEQGGEVEPWMSDLTKHLASTRQVLAEWKARQQ